MKACGKIDVRILAATARDLATEVQLERFREDLYFRLNVIRIEIPPLRRRRSDIPLMSKSKKYGIDPAQKSSGGSGAVWKNCCYL